MAYSLNTYTRFACEMDECNTDFARLADMHRHVKEMHGGVLRCPIPGCSWQGAKRKSRLDAHLRKEHGDISSLKFKETLNSFPFDGSQGIVARNARRRKNVDEEEEEEGNNPKSALKGARVGLTDICRQEHRGRRLACPFYLFNTETYCKNTRTGKRYETCSGPGWLAMHYLKQHLGNSAGSVHKKIRCPRCLNVFKTASAVLKHQKAKPPQCLQPSELNQDDISDDLWEKIDTEISRPGFHRLAQNEQGDIDLWVSANLEHECQKQEVEERKWDLRKWNMIWRILFPTNEIPLRPFYSDDVFMSVASTELLVKSFKETLNLGIESRKFNHIDDTTLDKLMAVLRIAISVASTGDPQQRNLLQKTLLNSNLVSETSHWPHNASSEITSRREEAVQEMTTRPEGTLSVTTSCSAAPAQGSSLHSVIESQLSVDAVEMTRIFHNADLTQNNGQNRISPQSDSYLLSQEGCPMNTPFDHMQYSVHAESPWAEFALERELPSEPLSHNETRSGASEPALECVDSFGRLATRRDVKTH
ncbi:hypothetical protein N431DRAFT_485699 [Stipitochalara longipes BDJ]|nr:hypothetical protein N431DRAFT_485699 [Stipitochalara longipes BDJ]